MSSQVITWGYGRGTGTFNRPITLGYGAASVTTVTTSRVTSFHNKDITWLEAQDITTIEEA